MIDYQLIGSRIKAARKNANMTQEKLAEKVGITTEHMSRLETGAAKVSLEIIAKIADELAIDAEDLLFGTMKKSSKYLNGELEACLKECTPEKKKAIVNMAKIVLRL